jgi:hypothetical protein
MVDLVSLLHFGRGYSYAAKFEFLEAHRNEALYQYFQSNILASPAKHGYDRMKHFGQLPSPSIADPTNTND